MKYIVLDIEATCWQVPPPGFVQETIEIGACILNPFGELESTFSQFIKPVFHPQLSHFCTELTTIKQEDVSRAKKFLEVIEDFYDWAELDDEESYCICTWGNFDRNLLKKDCERNDFDTEWLEHHINIRQQYQDLRKLKRNTALKTALEKENMDWVGRQHRALDDAFNLAKIVVKFIDAWQH